MLDSFDYKCVPLSEIPPVIRLANPWPELPPEVPQFDGCYDWESMFPKIAELYGKGVSQDEILWRLCIVSPERLRFKIKQWIREGRLVERLNPRRSGRWKTEHNRILYDWLLSGKTVPPIAKQMGFSRDVVQKRAHALGFNPVIKGTNRAYWVLDHPAETVI